MAGRKLKIGKFEHDNVRRGKPTKGRFDNWSKEFLNSPQLKDYDAYLWGSWPDRDNAPDIDILLTKGEGVELDTQEMEEISLLNLEKSLIESNMLVDLGFTDEKIRGFKDKMDIYKKTGKPIPVSGYVYGPQWYLDDKKIKDRTDWIGPFVEVLDNNMVKLGSTHPYPKQINSIHEFDKVYGNKPIKIKSSKR